MTAVTEGIRFRARCAIMDLSRQDSCSAVFCCLQPTRIADKGRHTSKQTRKAADAVFGETRTYADLCCSRGGKQVISDTSNTEWSEALAVARIMVRQQERRESLLPKAQKARLEREKRKAASATQKPQRKTTKIIPYVSRSKWDRHVGKHVKEFIYVRDEGRCFYCCCDVARFGAHFDHVLPMASGGKSTYGNLVLSCVKCNTGKSASILENLDDVLAEVRRRNREVFG